MSSSTGADKTENPPDSTKIAGCIAMFHYKIKLTKKPGTQSLENSEIVDMIDDYLSPLDNNGQFVSGYNLYSDGTFFYVTLVLPEEDSMSNAYGNHYVKTHTERLRTFFDIELIREGVDLEHHRSCACEKPSWFLLYPESGHYSPLICGDCRGSVPLYKVPYPSSDTEHTEILNWRNAYCNMRNLWVHSLWDRFTSAQMRKHNSKLNLEGRDICAELEKKLSVPVYYFLHYQIEAWVGAGKTPKVCPQCGNDWAVNPEFYKCETCRLITTNPDWVKRDDN